MSIVEKKPTEIANLDLSPISITIDDISNSSKELKQLQEEIIPLQDVNVKNIKLALQLKELREKYTETKKQLRERERTIARLSKIEQSLNIYEFACEKDGKIISLFNCNEACRYGYCTARYKCNTRRKQIKKHFNIE